MNDTSIKFYSLTNDKGGKIVLTPQGEIKNKPERSRVLMARIESLESQLATLQAKHDEEMAEAVRLLTDAEQRLSRIIANQFVWGSDDKDFAEQVHSYLAAHKENCPQCGDFGSKCEVCGCPGPNETKEEPKDGEVCEWTDEGDRVTPPHNGPSTAKTGSYRDVTGSLCPYCGKPIRLTHKEPSDD